MQQRAKEKGRKSITSSGVVGIAQNVTIRVEKLLKGSISSKGANVDCKVKSDVLPTVVKWFNRTTDLVKTCGKILLLPLPENAVQVAVV